MSLILQSSIYRGGHFRLVNSRLVYFYYFFLNVSLTWSFISLSHHSPLIHFSFFFFCQYARWNFKVPRCIFSGMWGVLTAIVSAVQSETKTREVDPSFIGRNQHSLLRDAQTLHMPWLGFVRFHFLLLELEILVLVASRSWHLSLDMFSSGSDKDLLRGFFYLFFILVSRFSPHWIQTFSLQRCYSINKIFICHCNNQAHSEGTVLSCIRCLLW